MKTLLYMAWAMLFATAVFADDFYLIDPDTKTKHGPFKYQNKSPIKVGDKTLYIYKVDKKKIYEEKLRAIIIPNIEFRAVALKDAIKFLADASTESGINGKNINFVLDTANAPKNKKAKKPRDDPFSFDDAGFGPQGENDLRITLSLRRISLYDAITYISKVANLDFDISENAVTFRYKKPAK